MPSQLALRITSEFDRKGFDAADRATKDLVKDLKNAQRATLDLEGAVGRIGRVALGAFSATGLQNFIAQAVEQERVVALLSNRFSLLGESGDEAARSAVNLTTSFSKFTRFSQSELLTALNLSLRTANSSVQAFNQLEVALNIASATGADLNSVTLALGRAQQGLVRPLSLITGLTSAQIREMEKQGNLIDELATKFNGFAQKEGQTLAGQLAIIRNRLGEVGQSIGRDFLPTIEAVTGRLANLPEPLAKTAIELGGVIAAVQAFKALGFEKSLASIITSSAGAGVALKSLLVNLGGLGVILAAGGLLFGVNRLSELFEQLKQSGDELARTNFGVAQALRRDVGAFTTFGQELQGVENAIAAVQSRLEALTDVESDQADRERAIFRDQLGRLQVRQRELNELIQLQEQASRVGLEAEEKRTRDLTKSRAEARQLELFEEISNSRRLLADARVVGEERRLLERKLQNDTIEFERAASEQRLSIRQSEIQQLSRIIEASRQLLLPGVNAEDLENSDLERRLRNIRQITQAEQTRISETLRLELEGIEERARRGEIVELEAEREKLAARQRAATEAAQLLQQAVEEAQPLETALGEARAGRSLVEDFKSQLSAAAEQQSVALDVQVRFGDREIERVIGAVDRGLRRLDIEIENSARRRRTAPSGVR